MNLKHILWTLLLCCCAVTAGAQTYRVGDLYTAPDGSQGIVFFVFPDGTGGWVVALNDAPESCYWGSYVDITDLVDIMPTNYQELLADTSGYTNTAIIRNQLNNNNYAAGVVDFANGWYLPAMGQLRMLYSKRSILDTLLVAAGGTKFANGSYWSSSEVSSTNAWVIEFGSHYNQGQCYSTSKYLSCHVRAVRTFTYEPTYVWSTGDTAVSITVAPLQTTEYTVTISSPVGCSNDETYNVLVNSLDTTPVNITACESYTWNGVTYDTSGIFLEHHQNANGCDSMVILNLTIHNPIHQSITATGIESYEWHDSVYTQDGDYLFSHLDENGCTQVDTLHLTIYHGTMTQFDTTVCESDLPFEWDGVVFTTAGTHIDSLATFAGADSLVFWNLHVVELPVITHSPDTEVLAGDSLTLWAAGSEILTWTDGNGNPVGNGATVSIRPLTSGYYYVTGYNSGGIVGDDTSALHCPATDSIWVEILPNPDTMLLTDSVCVYYVWYGDTLTQSGIYYHGGMTNWLGYDSVEVLALTVFPTTYGTLDTTVIENALPLVYNDSIYSAEGTYTQILTNVEGCDSVLAVNVLVHYNLTTEAFDTICESQFPHTWNDSLFTAAGTKQTTILASTGADSTVVMHLMVISTTYGTVNLGVVENALPLQYNDSVYEGEGTYTQYLTNVAGCDSVLTVTVTVYENVENMADSVICEGDLPFIWNGITFTEAGSQPVILTASTGADSVLLMNVTVTPTTYGTLDTTVVENALPLSINDSFCPTEGTYTQTLTNAQGCDSILAVNVFVHYNVTAEADSIICESELPIEWNGVFFATAVTQTAVLTAHTGADSTVVMQLTVIPTTYGTLDTTVIENALPLNINDSLYSTEGTYTQYLTNAQGCDSLLVVNVFVHYNMTTNAYDTICENQLPLEWNDSVFTEAGLKQTTIFASTGADSTVVMHLTVNYPSDSTLYLTIYERELPYTLNADTYDTAGVYMQTHTNVAGCDSTLTVVLAVIPTVYANVDSTICSNELPLTWNGVEFTEAGTQTATLLAANGTDSVLTMTLLVNAVTGTTLNAEVVQNNLPYTLNDSTYTASGTYYQHFTNAAGCDSIVTLNLTVYNNATSQMYATACASALPYTWSGHVFEAAGTFTDTLLTTHGADSVVTYTLTVDNISTTIGNVDHIVCYGDSTGFATAMVTGGQPPMTYAWTNTANTILSTTTTLSSVPAGFYTFTVTDVIGCTAVDTVTIVSLFGEVDPGTISADQVVCSGEQPAPFTGTAATGSDHITYFWEFSSDGEIWSTAQGVYNTQNYTYPYPAPFSFFLRRLSIIQGCGTYYSNVVTVSVWPNTIDTVTGAVCQGEAFEGFGFDITADQIAAPGDYTFEQHHATGHCDSMVVLILTVNPLFETEVEDVVCEGEGYDDNGFSIAPLETVGEEQLTRTQTLQSAAGCDSVVTLHLSVIDTAVRIVSLTPDFCEDLSAELMVVTDMPNYVWSTGETEPTITVTYSGRYYVTATSGECSSTAHFTVENCDGNQLLLPNAITPSKGDGVNDYFSIPERNLHSINLFEIWIYNRWGELVYYSNDKNFRWNGEYRGQIQYQTVYNYMIRYTDDAGKPYFVKGSVTVL